MATCMAILHVGSTQQVRTGSTSSKEEDYENDAATIVQKCVSEPHSVHCFPPQQAESTEIVFICTAIHSYSFGS